MPEVLPNNSFDLAAKSYDMEFTHSKIGMAQRERVWFFLDRALKSGQHQKILELNCGTGADATKLVQLGYQVVATDVSQEMLNVAKSKPTGELVDFKQLDLNEFSPESFSQKFDIVFSNFGGLNCISSKTLENVINATFDLLNPGGKFIAVIMSDFCAWETFYFLMKGSKSKAFRRKKMVLANVSGVKVKTWYFHPNVIKNMGFRFESTISKPIGLFIPPSYLESFFSKHLKLLKMLTRLENSLGRFSWQSAYSDHYYIELTKS